MSNLYKKLYRSLHNVVVKDEIRTDFKSVAIEFVMATIPSMLVIGFEKYLEYYVGSILLKEQEKLKEKEIDHIKEIDVETEDSSEPDEEEIDEDSEEEK